MHCGQMKSSGEDDMFAQLRHAFQMNADSHPLIQPLLSHSAKYF